MISLFLTIVGILIIFVIARMNKSIKLFIFLLIAFLGGIIAGNMTYNILQKNKPKQSTCVIYKTTSSQSIVANLSSNTIATEGSIISLSGTERFNESYIILHTNKLFRFMYLPSVRGLPTIMFDTS